jgi:hypothetical protein
VRSGEACKIPVKKRLWISNYALNVAGKHQQPLHFPPTGVTPRLLIEAGKSLPEPYVLFTLGWADFSFNPLRQAKQNPSK